MRVTEDAVTPSVASAARRQQIVAATIEVVAERGLAQSSFARIAERAGISSTRLISYHFADKDDLIGAVVAEVLRTMGEYVGQRIDDAEKVAGRGDATAILRAYIAGNVAFIATHRPQMQALMQIVLGSGGLPSGSSGPSASSGPSGSSGPGGSAGQPDELPIEGLLRHGQSTGQFRDFDVPAVASAIQRAIEGLPFMLAAQPDLDCDRYAAELVELYLRGVRREPR